MTLPYPGYSWSFSQHMGKINPKQLFSLLEIAYRFRSQVDYESLINEALVIEKVLTPNFRSDSGQVDAWRDYQQILSELGLIYSTRYSKTLDVTPMGLMYIDRAIGYSELLSTQVLSYQYPNGHKTTISSSLKKKLLETNQNIPKSRIDLDINSGILIKPGVLILQILVELARNGERPTIDTRECLLALIPTKNNNDWQEAYFRLKKLRKSDAAVQLGSREHRHVQEWFQFLGQSDFAIKHDNKISLSSTALTKIDKLQLDLDFHINPENFWIPIAADNRENALSWYGFFGNPIIESQWIAPDELRSQEYILNNYPDIELLDEIDNPHTVADVSEINLRPFSPSIPEMVDANIEVNVENIVRGRIRLRDKTRQHQEIIAQLATRLMELSYTVTDDPNSVDLLAEKNGCETIFEIKTINRRNFQPRIRLGVGQLSEYRYRRQLQTQVRPNSILVLSNTFKMQQWEPKYFSSEVNIGILCSKSNSFLALTDGAVEQEVQH